MVQKYGKKQGIVPLIFIIIKGVLIWQPRRHCACSTQPTVGRYRNCFAEQQKLFLLNNISLLEWRFICFPNSKCWKMYSRKRFFINMQQTVACLGYFRRSTTGAGGERSFRNESRFSHCFDTWPWITSFECCTSGSWMEKVQRLFHS